MLCASLVTSAGNRAAAVSRITCRTRGSAVREIALRLTITTSAQDGSAASARTTAAPTSPVPPMIKTRNAILSLFLPAGQAGILRHDWIKLPDGLPANPWRLALARHPARSRALRGLDHHHIVLMAGVPLQVVAAHADLVAHEFV